MHSDEKLEFRLEILKSLYFLWSYILGIDLCVSWYIIIFKYLYLRDIFFSKWICVLTKL